MFGRRAKTYRSRPLSPRLQGELNATQGLVPGFDLAPLQRAHVVLIGAGGLGFPVATGLMHQGVGRLTILDDDVVEHKNWTRQYFSRADVGKNKAHRLAKHLAANALFPLRVTGYPLRFQELLERDHDFGDTTLFVCGVDNNPSRQAVTRFAVDHHLPVIHAAIGRDANAGYTFVQAPSQACWGCAFPHMLNHNAYPCGLPATNDLTSVTAGLILYATASIINQRPRHWNLREVFMDGDLPDRTRTVERKPDCPLCSSLARR